MKHDAVRLAMDAKKKQVNKKKRNMGRRGNKRINPDGTDKFYNGLNNKFLDYEQAKLFCHAAEFVTSASEYKEWVKIKKYSFLPLSPNIVYAPHGWEGWGTYLGTGNESPRASKRNYPPYLEAKAIAQKLAVQFGLVDMVGDSRMLWLDLLDTQYMLPEHEREIPSNLNRNPQEYYDEWEGWPEYLGRDTARGRSNGNGSREAILKTIQQKEQISKDPKNDYAGKYSGEVVYAVTTGVDPIRENVVKIIVNYIGITELLSDCQKLQYDVIGVFIFDKNKVTELTLALEANGNAQGDTTYLIRDMNALLYDLRHITEEIDLRKL